MVSGGEEEAMLLMTDDGFGGGEEEAMLLMTDDGFGPSSSDSPPSSWAVMCLCRICHEEEEERSTSMEAPCTCSGTLKYAHRGCIQRWCDEKGSTTCEICLQKFEPGYTLPVKKTLVEVGVTIRGSLEVPRQNYHPQTSNQGDADEDDEADYAECSPASQRSASCCQSVAVAFTIILLLRHLISVIAVGADDYAFSLLTVFILRASGILLPFYVIMSAIKGIQQVQRIQLQHQLYENVAESEDQRLHQHVIEIQS